VRCSATPRPSWRSNSRWRLTCQAPLGTSSKSAQFSLMISSRIDERSFPFVYADTISVRKSPIEEETGRSRRLGISIYVNNSNGRRKRQHITIGTKKRLAEILLEWRVRTPFNGPDNWLFTNPATEKPYHQEEIQKKHLKRAAKEAKIVSQKREKFDWKREISARNAITSFKSEEQITSRPASVGSELLSLSQRPLESPLSALSAVAVIGITLPVPKATERINRVIH
jgi:hypothetical protein